MPKKGKGILSKVSNKNFIKYVNNSVTWTELLKKCGYNNTGNKKTVVKRLIKMKIDYSHLPVGFYSPKGVNIKRKSNIEVFCENSTYQDRKKIKNRLYNDFNWERKCNCCKLTEWMDKPIPLELEHKNGINNDHRIENLELLCPNCHALTDTYRGKNKAYKKKKKTCVDCDTSIYKTSTRCNKCAHKHKWLLNINNRPSLEQLKKDLLNSTYVSVGKKYNVSNNTVKKWLKLYEKYK